MGVLRVWGWPSWKGVGGIPVFGFDCVRRELGLWVAWHLTKSEGNWGVALTELEENWVPGFGGWLGVWVAFPQVPCVDGK